MFSSILISALLLFSLGQAVDYTQFVNPLVGSSGGGNTFPGVSRPWGIVKLGPDLYNGPTDAYSGYLPAGDVFGFSLTHESGTGGAPKYGVVSQMPWLGNITNPLGNLSANRTTPDTAYVGYYRTELNGTIANATIGVELAAGDRAGLYRYNFSETMTLKNVVVDVSHVLSSFRGQGLEQNYTGGSISTFTDGHYEAEGMYDNGWNEAPNWAIYSCGRFDQMPASMNVFVGSGPNLTSYGNMTSAMSFMNLTSQRVGAVFSFPPNTSTLSSRVGVSFISSSQACANLDAQITNTTTFTEVVNGTVDAWNNEIFSKVVLPDASVADQSLFYTMMYGAFLIPSNKTGENPKWNSTEPYYDDTFTLWDLNRCGTALWHVLQPTFYEEYIRSLIDIYRFDGYMPDARSSFQNGATQGGSNCDNVLADAYVKGVRGAVNWTDGYAAMQKDALVTPPNNLDPRANDSSTAQGRGALPDWIQYGYITPSFSRSVSRAVEYAVNDFSLYQVASGLNQTADIGMYLNRSAQWRNHWNPAVQSLNATGFVVPRSANGSFIEQDPLYCGGCYWGDFYYEALPWEYSFGMIHDVATLVNYSGGPDMFKARLDAFFAPGNNPKNSTGTSQFNFTINNPSNEPDFDTPFLYHFVGRPDLSLQNARFVAKSYYFDNSTGLPGNSDAGAMETWWLWNSIGLYPLTGQTTFLIHAPWYSMNIDLGNGKSLNITTNGGNSDTAYQVQSLQINGSDWRQSWLTYDDVFAYGGTMNFTLGANYTGWFNNSTLPPSPGSAGVPKFAPNMTAANTTA